MFSKSRVSFARRYCALLANKYTRFLISTYEFTLELQARTYFKIAFNTYSNVWYAKMLYDLYMKNRLSVGVYNTMIFECSRSDVVVVDPPPRAQTNSNPQAPQPRMGMGEDDYAEDNDNVILYFLQCGQVAFLVYAPRCP